MIRLKYLLLIILLITFNQLVTAKGENDANLIIVMVDGARWQEVFRGADANLIKGKIPNSNDKTAVKNRFWAESVKDRRALLMPFTWRFIASKGQLYGNRDLGNKMDVKNSYWISFPGRAELLSGFVDPNIKSNDQKINSNMNILEFLNAQTRYKNKVAAFGGWNGLGRCLNKGKSGIYINDPYDPIVKKKLSETEKLANEIQALTYQIGNSDSRSDYEVYSLAKSYLLAEHPKVIYIGLIDVDHDGHANDYEHYLIALNRVDKILEILWSSLQNDKFYKDKTYFLVTTDHGRGDQSTTWMQHGIGRAPGSGQTWFMLMGPNIPAKGEIKLEQQNYTSQLAKTMGFLLGFNYQANQPVDEMIRSIFNSPPIVDNQNRRTLVK